MLVTLMKSKLHRATVTQADLDYVGSITVDADLLDAADLLPGERVDVCDCENGNRLSTYVIPGERGAGEICVNGAKCTTSSKRLYSSGSKNCSTGLTAIRPAARSAR